MSRILPSAPAPLRPWGPLAAAILLCGCQAAAAPAAEPGARAVRLATAGAQLPAGAGQQPPVSVFPADQLPERGTRVTCPVCGDEFVIGEPGAPEEVGTSDGERPLRHYKGKVIIFCCKRCLPHFDKDPDLFLGPVI